MRRENEGSPLAAMKLAIGIAVGTMLGAVATAMGGSDSPELKIGRALMTFYWVIDESSSRYAHRHDVVIRDPRGGVIAQTSAKFRRELIMEGAGRLRDGRMVLYSRKTKGEHRFRLTSTPYGKGVTGCPLVPYRTIAVDPDFVRLGSKVFIPQLQGARLPDGTLHDGLFSALDRGQFRGAHIDVFVGVGSRGSRVFSRKGYGSRSHVTLYRADESQRSPRRCE